MARAPYPHPNPKETNDAGKFRLNDGPASVSFEGLGWCARDPHRTPLDPNLLASLLPPAAVSEKCGCQVGVRV